MVREQAIGRRHRLRARPDVDVPRRHVVGTLCRPDLAGDGLGRGLGPHGTGGVVIALDGDVRLRTQFTHVLGVLR